MDLFKKQSLALFTLCFLTVTTFAADGVAMADELRNSGKIYIVVIVILIIFTGIVGFLINLDRKISKLEKEISKEG